MQKTWYWATGALFAGLTLAGAAPAGQSAPIAQSGITEGLTQDLSARRYCRNVVTYRWRHGHRHPQYKRVCYNTRTDCRTVVKYRWRHGERVKVRTRVC